MRRTTFRARTFTLEGSALVGLLLAVSLSGCGGGADAQPNGQPPSPEATPTPSSTHAPVLASDGAIEPGTYLVPSGAASAVDFTVTFPEGWRVRYGKLFDTNSEQVDELSFEPFVVDKTYADACQGERGAQTEVGPGVEDLVDALLAQPGPAKSGPVETTLGGYPATRVDLRVPDRLQSKDCFMGPGTGVQIWLSEPDDYLVLDPEGIASVYVLDVDGERAVFVSQYRPVQTSYEDHAELQQVLDSIRIEE